MVVKTKKIKNIDLLMPANLPPRPMGPPAIIKATTKWSGKWLLLALAVAVAGALTKWAKTASKFKRS